MRGAKRKYEKNFGNIEISESVEKRHNKSLCMCEATV